MSTTQSFNFEHNKLDNFEYLEQEMNYCSYQDELIQENHENPTNFYLHIPLPSPSSNSGVADINTKDACKSTAVHFKSVYNRDRLVLGFN